ncbi:MAG: CBS domain-containing protein [Planctomycetota bacterium]|jgi:CBS-domain-containing membrane protein
MGEHIVARDLMLQDVAGIRGDQTVSEAMQALVDLQADAEVPNALVVLDAEGRYHGILTARLLCKTLMKLWAPDKAAGADQTLLEQELLDMVRDRGKLKVQDALIWDQPTAAAGDRLLPLVELACDKRLEFIPVVDNGHVLGLVPVTQIFLAAAGLALTPEHEGIRFDQEPGR